MAAPILPELIEHYQKYCGYRKSFQQTGRLDLSGETFLYPTTLLPLLILIQKVGAEKVIMPRSRDVASYIAAVTRPGSIQESRSYIPFMSLPRERQDIRPVMERIRKLCGDDKVVAINLDAFMLIVSEMVDNIYEHSEFNVAYALAQRYPNLRVLDLCFADDGITIPGSFERIGIRYEKNEHNKAIRDVFHIIR